MINATDAELDELLAAASIRQYKRKQALSEVGKIPNEIFFINSGLLRIVITDRDGVEHTKHFAMEGQFIADYSNYILKKPALYTLQALEPMEVVVLPRQSIEWGYEHMAEGNKLGRLIAEYYFVYQDTRLRDMYERSPRERYDLMADVFPNIHNRVPQHMIASYLGITSIHLSRLKRGVVKM